MPHPVTSVRLPALPMAPGLISSSLIASTLIAPTLTMLATLALLVPADARAQAAAATASTTTVAAQAATKAAPGKRLPPMVVHRSASCGCCGVWVEHLRRAGFAVSVVETENLAPIKQRVGVPDDKTSCHTAEVGGYFVEGHVPADDIKRLLRQKPAAKGLTVPGMPLGSPGMEMPDGRVERYDVELVKRDGTTSVFATHGTK